MVNLPFQKTPEIEADRSLEVSSVEFRLDRT